MAPPRSVLRPCLEHFFAVGGEFGVELRTDAGEVPQFRSLGTVHVVGVHVVVSEQEAAPHALEVGFLEEGDQFTKTQGLLRALAGKLEVALILVDHAVKDGAFGGAARADADDVEGGGLERDPGDLDLVRRQIRQVFATHEAGVNPAGERADVFRQSFPEDLLGDGLEVSGGESFADFLTAEVALNVLEDCLGEGLVLPVGSRTVGVVDVRVAFHTVFFRAPDRPASNVPRLLKGSISIPFILSTYHDPTNPPLRHSSPD